MAVKPRLAAFLLSALLISLGVSCGVSFREKFDGTELFKSINVCDEAGDVCTKGATPEFLAGARLNVDLVVTQGYPVPVDVACYYEDGDRLTDDQEKVAFQERATPAAESVLPASTSRSPGDKHQPEQHLTFRFSISEPGDYFLACLTPAAADNGIGVPLKIR